MPGKLYKYFAPQLAESALSGNGATLKFSLPTEFNDPYELFLTVDHDSPPATLAFYDEVIGEITGMPTTCFSRNPDVVPMWAHYGQNGEGFAIEVDEDLLCAQLGDSCVVEDVDYRDTRAEGLAESLARAQVRQKPRDVYFLRNRVYWAAYFTKATCWSYEKERRVVLNDSDDLVRTNGISLLPIPKNCITAIILGASIDAATQSKLRSLATLIGCTVYECRIGRNNITPFFLASNGSTYVFADGKISPAAKVCQTCREPQKEGDRCSWCRIEEADRETAAANNPWRLLDATGLLKEYIESMNAIGKQ
jgi:Protein of unknown function (DUF2971)